MARITLYFDFVIICFLMEGNFNFYIRYQSVSLHMRQPEITKENVLMEATKLFNTKGYKTTSISDITGATGYTKGAIYRHFENKEALEMEAFEKMMATIFTIMSATIKANDNTKDKLFALLDMFEKYISNPFVKGGCPLLNVAIEMDDTNDPLKQKAQKALEILKSAITKIIDNGKKFNEVKPIVKSVLCATIIIATVEGGIMMSKLQNDNSDIIDIILYLKKWIKEEILK
jgi:TetR/AcrR family transcriptional regulator, transcriptional repressor for nem operon